MDQSNKLTSASEKLLIEVEKIKSEIQQNQSKLKELKTKQNVHCLQRIRQLEQQIKALESINLNSETISKITLLNQSKNNQQSPKNDKKSGNQQLGGSSLFKDLNVQMQGSQNMGSVENQGKFLDSMEMSSSSQSRLGADSKYNGIISNDLSILHNITTNKYKQSSLFQQEASEKVNKMQTQVLHSKKKHVSVEQEIEQMEQQALEQTKEQTYRLLNQYLSHKKSFVFEKLAQIRPKTSLQIAHQRVILKEHLDWLRKYKENLKQENRTLAAETDGTVEALKMRYSELRAKVDAYND